MAKNGSRPDFLSALLLFCLRFAPSTGRFVAARGCTTIHTILPPGGIGGSEGVTMSTAFLENDSIALSDYPRVAVTDGSDDCATLCHEQLTASQALAVYR